MSAPVLEVTEPGVYDGMPSEVYHAHPALSSSGARKLLAPSCPAKFAYEREHGQSPKRVFDFGRAAHRRVLGVGDNTVVIDAENYLTKAAKGQRDAAYAAGSTPILPSEEKVIEQMAAALKAHPYAGALFDPEQGGRAEQSLFWTDEETGVPCRARLDWLRATDGGRLLVPDYKTAAEADLESASKALENYGNARQGSWYLDGVIALGLAESAEFLLVIQEKTPPFLVTVVVISAESLRAARYYNRQARLTFAECTATGRWPGYTDDGPAYLPLPGWALNRYYEESGQ